MKARFALVPVTELREHEQVVESRVAALAKRLVEDGHVDQPVVADARTGVVIDGHHRLSALRRLGAARAPVHLIDYMDPAVTLTTWRATDPPPTKEEVVRRAIERNPYPPKTTRHPDLYDLPKVRTALADLGCGPKR